MSASSCETWLSPLTSTHGWGNGLVQGSIWLALAVRLPPLEPTHADSLAGRIRGDSSWKSRMSPSRSPALASEP